jgi:SAM-dependent methyltransferase
VHQDESEYWDKEAKEKGDKDNVWKRVAIIKRLFEIDWIDQRVLEIGVGAGMVAGVLKYVFLNNFKYRGTDVSPEYCERAKKFLMLDMYNTDILNLPKIEGGFTKVIALDSLEHIRPEERDQGYRNIGERLAPDSLMVINMPLNESYHDERYDHPFTQKDILRLAELAEMELKSFEIYTVYPFGAPAHYGWAVLQRGLG